MKRQADADRRRHRPAGERRRDLRRRSTATARRAWASRARDVDNALYNAFGQRQVATIYDELNQYQRDHGAWRRATRASPEALNDVYVPARAAPRARARPATTATATRGRDDRRRPTRRCATRRPARPSSTRRRAWCRCRPSRASPSGRRRPRSTTRTASSRPRSRSTWPRAATWPTRRRRSRAGRGRDRHADQRARQLPGHGAQLRRSRRAQQPLLILAALVVIYIVLGVLYESLVHPITVLSTLPSAGVGAVLALLLFKHGVLDHRADRRVPADRHRQEERHPDHRLRARGRALARPVAARGGARGLPAALPADPDDHAGRRPGRAAAGDRLRRRRRAAPAAGHRDHRRPDRQPAADAADHAGRLPAARQAAPPRRRRAAL